MRAHRAYGKSLDTLHVAIVDGRRGMGQVLHSALLGLGVSRVHCYESVTRAFAGLMDDPPDVVLLRDTLEPIGGALFCQLLRRDDMRPACEAAVVFMAASMNRSSLQKALLAGAHQILVLPVSPAQLARRLTLLGMDARGFSVANGRYEIEGTRELLVRIRMDGLLGKGAEPPPVVREAPERGPRRDVWEI